MIKFSRGFAVRKYLFVIGVTLILTNCSQADPSIHRIQEFISVQNIDKNKHQWKLNLAKPPQVEFSTDKKYFWELQTTQGHLSILLMPEIAPMHVSSTIYLTLLGFYDDLIFHRVIPRFMAQGGDPQGVGTGGPGYFYTGEFSSHVRHNDRGILSMANRGPNTDGSQFFITLKATPHLDGKHTIFGTVINGLDTLKKIEELGSYSGKTKQEIKILKATIKVK